MYLTTIREITETMNVSEKTVRRWIREGAPIGVDSTPGGKKRYRTEKHTLMQWLIGRRNETA